MTRDSTPLSRETVSAHKAARLCESPLLLDVLDIYRVYGVRHFYLVILHNSFNANVSSVTA